MKVALIRRRDCTLPSPVLPFAHPACCPPNSPRSLEQVDLAGSTAIEDEVTDDYKYFGRKALVRFGYASNMCPPSNLAPPLPMPPAAQAGPATTPLPCFLLPQQGGKIAHGPPLPTSWRCGDASHHAVPPGHRAASTFCPLPSGCWRAASNVSDGGRGLDLRTLGGSLPVPLLDRMPYCFGVYC